ncbi:hypothetical protein BC826DRAFT_1043821 [Russula brevipes]|nr:hypothetical protein BC826DRAFT_1043821 [Russula brevipes]
MSEDYASPRVNSARVKDYLGASHPVRVTGKLLNFSNDDTYLLMEAADGGQVKVLLPSRSLRFPSGHRLVVVGFADLDLALVNQVVELTFDPKFKGKLF